MKRIDQEKRMYCTKQRRKKVPSFAHFWHVNNPGIVQKSSAGV